MIQTTVVLIPNWITLGFLAQLECPGLEITNPSLKKRKRRLISYPNGMKRKQLTEVVLTARGIEIPPAYEPVKTNGDTNDSSES